MKKGLLMMLVLAMMVLSGCGAGKPQVTYKYQDEERRIQDVSGRECFIWVPESWKFVKENDRIYVLDGETVLMTQTALHPYDGVVSETVENTPYMKDIQVLELKEIEKLESGMQTGTYKVSQGGEVSEKYFMHLGRGAESDFVFIVWDESISYDLVKEVANSIEAH